MYLVFPTQTMTSQCLMLRPALLNAGKGWGFDWFCLVVFVYEASEKQKYIGKNVSHLIRMS